MKVVVTGANGFIGRKVVSRLTGLGHEVVPVIRTATEGSSAQTRVWGSELFAPDEAFDALVDLAWNTGERGSWPAQMKALDRVADIASEIHRFRIIIGLGTSDEYGLAEGTLKEDRPPAFPLSPYGWAKRAAWTMLESRARLAQVPLVWLRPFTVYGEGQSGAMLLPYAIQCAKEKQPAQFTDGLQTRDFVHVDDVARAIVCALDCDDGGVFNVGTGRGTSVRSVIEEIAREFDVHDHFKLGALPRPSHMSLEQTADTESARERLGFVAEQRFEEGLARVLKRARKASPIHISD